MKKLTLLIFCITINAIVQAQSFSGLIEQEFFNPSTPFEITEVEGYFNGVYLVQSHDNIPYTEIKIFDNQNFDSPYSSLKYYSYSNRTSETVAESIIEIYGQSFSLRYRKNISGENMVRDIMWSAGKLWRFNYMNEEYLCYVTHWLNAIDPQFMVVLLFDITDKEDVQFMVFDTFDQGYIPQIGIRSDVETGLCILRTDPCNMEGAYDPNLRTRLCAITNGKLEPVYNEEGQNIEVFWYWHRQEYEQLSIYEDKNHNNSFEKIRKYKNNILIFEVYSTNDDGIFDRVIQYE